MIVLTQEQLEDIIRYHRYLYYNGYGIISDYEFDKLYNQLKERFPESKVILEELECPKEFYFKCENQRLKYKKLFEMEERLDNLEKSLDKHKSQD